VACEAAGVERKHALDTALEGLVAEVCSDSCDEGFDDSCCPACWSILDISF
jgi:hypothetical protein